MEPETLAGGPVLLQPSRLLHRRILRQARLARGHDGRNRQESNQPEPIHWQLPPWAAESLADLFCKKTGSVSCLEPDAGALGEPAVPEVDVAGCQRGSSRNLIGSSSYASCCPATGDLADSMEALPGSGVRSGVQARHHFA